MAESVQALLDRITEVCPVPATAQRVLALTSGEGADLAAVAEAVASDPALGAEVLRIANSPAYRRGEEITDIGRAVSVLGLVELHDMASAMAMLAAFGSRSELGLRFHDRAVLAATIARRLAAESGAVPQGTAFVAGLLSEIGAMACLSVDPTRFEGIVAAAGADMEERGRREAATYGATSRHIGARLLARNGLPDVLSVAVAGETPTADRDALERITELAWRVTPALVEAGVTGDTAPLEGTATEAMRHAGLGMPMDGFLGLCFDCAGLTASVLSHQR